MRTIAILNKCSDRNVYENIISKIPNDGIVDKIVWFASDDVNVNIESDNLIVVKIPEDIDSRPKLKNFASKWALDNNVNGYFHVIEDSTNIICEANKLQQFLNDVEVIMDILDLKSWMSTTCDVMNYVYEKFNPRIKVNANCAEAQLLGLPDLAFTSHANPQWMVFNMNLSTYEDMEFDEQFSIPMFYIVSFLANRREHSSETDLNFMGLYPTPLSEVGVFRRIDCNADVKIENLQSEEIIFKSKGKIINADNSLDIVLERLYEKLILKTSN